MLWFFTHVFFGFRFDSVPVADEDILTRRRRAEFLGMRYDEMKPKTQQFLSLFADGDQQYLVGGLEHDFYDFPYIGNNTLN